MNETKPFTSRKWYLSRILKNWARKEGCSWHRELHYELELLALWHYKTSTRKESQEVRQAVVGGARLQGIHNTLNEWWWKLALDNFFLMWRKFNFLHGRHWLLKGLLNKGFCFKHWNWDIIFCHNVDISWLLTQVSWRQFWENQILEPVLVTFCSSVTFCFFFLSKQKSKALMLAISIMAVTYSLFQ